MRAPLQREHTDDQPDLTAAQHMTYQCGSTSTVSKAISPHQEHGAGQGIGTANAVALRQLEHTQPRLRMRSSGPMILSGSPRRSMMSFSSMGKI
jgi:hypothetical protein